jgi:hypothetical protein
MLYLGSYVISIEALLEVFYYNRYNNYILPIDNAISLDVLMFVELSPPIISKRECHPVSLPAEPGLRYPTRFYRPQNFLSARTPLFHPVESMKMNDDGHV